MTYIAMFSEGKYYYGGLVTEEELMYIDWVCQFSSYEECIEYIKANNNYQA